MTRRETPLHLPYEGPPNDEAVASVAYWYGRGCSLSVAARLAGCNPKAVRSWMREGKAADLKKRNDGRLTGSESAMRRARKTLRAARKAFLATLITNAKKGSTER